LLFMKLTLLNVLNVVLVWLLVVRAQLAKGKQEKQK